jgi:hypothetical protein
MAKVQPRLEGIGHRLRIDPAESVGAAKERWQLAITRQGQPPPHP